MQPGGKTIGLIGGLAAAPRRIVARHLAERDAAFRHGVTRKTDLVVFGKKLLNRSPAQEIAARHHTLAKAGKRVWGEREFLRWVRDEEGPALALDRDTLCAQSGLDADDCVLLSLFAAFEGDGTRFAFTDVILARKYAGLIASGADWFAIARQLAGAPKTSLTAFALRPGPAGIIYAERNDLVSDLSGQTVLPFAETDEDIDDLFEAAEEAEGEGETETAIALYRRCLAADPTDSVAAFNLGNCLASHSDKAEARHLYQIAIKRDPTFVEAWFNLATLLREGGDVAGARRHLERAIAIDPSYADAVYNLAALQFDAGNLDAARRHWLRYLELDPHTAWAQTATRGIQYVDMQNACKAAGQ